MDTIYWRMNATQGGANLHLGVNLHREQICNRVQIEHMNTALVLISRGTLFSTHYHRAAILVMHTPLYPTFIKQNLGLQASRKHLHTDVNPELHLTYS